MESVVPGAPSGILVALEPEAEDTDQPVHAGPTRPWVVALVIFALAAALRVVYVMALREHPRFDAPVMDAGYHLAWARALAEGTEFREGPLFRAPLYPESESSRRCSEG